MEYPHASHIDPQTHPYTHANLKLLPEFLIAFFSLGWDRYVEVLALFLTEQLKPACMCVCMSLKDRK